MDDSTTSFLDIDEIKKEKDKLLALGSVYENIIIEQHSIDNLVDLTNK